MKPNTTDLLVLRELAEAGKLMPSRFEFSAVDQGAGMCNSFTSIEAVSVSIGFSGNPRSEL
jgi:hypothetical protein